MMKKAIKAVLLLCCLSCLPAHADAANPAPQVHISMRGHGYHLGDIIVQQVRVQHTPGQTVDRKSLPLPGPVKPWLDLKTIQASSLTNGTEMTLVWQVFATVETAQQLQLPGWVFTLSGQPSTVVSVPASPFYQSPIFSHSVNQIDRKLTHVPFLYDVHLWQWLTIMALALSVLLAVIALWSQDKLPWLPFRPGPLCQAQRKIVREQHNSEASATMVYRGLCQLAGVTLHKHNLSKLLTQAPYLQPLQHEIEVFVRRYCDYQFDYQPLVPAIAATYIDVKELVTPVLRWLPQAALLERAFRKSA